MSARRARTSALLLAGLLAAGHATAQPADGDSEAGGENVEQKLEAQEKELAEQKKRLESQERQLAEQKKRLDALEAGSSGEATTEPTEASDDDAAVAAIIADVESEESATTEGDTDEVDTDQYAGGRPLAIYGFIDMGFDKVWAQKGSLIDGVGQTRANSFVLGNINVFFDAQPSPEWRSLVELRFTTLPNGEVTSFGGPGTTFERTNTRTTDSTNPSRRNIVIAGSTIIERAWIEWSGSDEFSLRSGYFFTPWGIWNIDHGTPTLIALLLPDSQIVQYYPLQQLGVQAHGSVFAGSWELGYHAYVSNGRIPGQFDLTEDKAVGGRLFARHESGGDSFTAGTSGYYGTYVETEKNITSFSPFTVEETRTVEAREWAAGADLSADIGKLRLRSEGALKRTDYETGKREQAFGAPGAVAPDRYEWHAYALGAYRLPWAGLEPYLWFEVLHRPSDLGDTAFVPSVGLNIYFTPEVSLRTQLARVIFTDQVTDADRDPGKQSFTAFLSRLVLAF